MLTKTLKKLDLFAYFFQKWVHVEKALMKLNIFIFDDELLEDEKYNEIWETVRNSIKK